MAPTCTTCTRSFKDKFALARHLETSSSEHPSCSLCSKRFTSTEALEAHYQGTANSKHPNCIVCGRGFVDKQALAQHRRAGCQPSPPKVKKYHNPEPASGRNSVTPLSSQHHRTSSLDSNAQEFLPSCAASFNALRNSPATPLSVSTATAQTFLPLTSEPSPWRYSQDTLVSQDTPSSPEARFTYLPNAIVKPSKTTSFLRVNTTLHPLKDVAALEPSPSISSFSNMPRLPPVHPTPPTPTEYMSPGSNSSSEESSLGATDLLTPSSLWKTDIDGSSSPIMRQRPLSGIVTNAESMILEQANLEAKLAQGVLDVIEDITSDYEDAVEDDEIAPPALSIHCRKCGVGQAIEPTATICGHFFCYECISQAVIDEGACPCCDNKLLLYCIFRLNLED